MAKASSSGWSSALAGGADTIVARATPAGSAAVAMVRLSGPRAHKIGLKMCKSADFGSPWRARLVEVGQGDGSAGEWAVAIPYAAPRSYTGEDMLELLVHGSPFVVNRLIDAAMAAGARPAGPGEFTRRAVANNKLDLVQAEAVRDLVAAETAWQARNAREQLAGRLSCRFAALRDQLVGLLARVEAELDFAAQGVTADPADLARRLEGCREEVVALLATADAGIRIRDGVRVVITGPPNSGKSTLFNTLLGTSRAIVAPEPGTTRDVLEAELELGGLRVTLVDAAGIRRTTDPVESEGVQRAMAELVEAGVIVELWPVDGAAQEPVPEGSRRQVLGVRSKADLGGEGWRAESGWLAVSCVTGEGVEALRKELETAVSGRVPDLGGEVAISRRHRRSLERASSELAACALEIPELAAENLRWAAAAVSELIGDVVSEDVLDEVFATFCIGK